MSVYNEPIEWIEQSIQSIQNQTFENFEFIIINDNPANPEIKELLRRYSAEDRRIILIENKENIGLTKSLNVGIRASKGKYIARMDADDISMPTRFQVQYDYMESHSDIDVCGTWAIQFGDISMFSSKKLKTPVTDDEIRIQALVYNPMIHPSVFLRRERLPERLYNEEFKKAQDYALWAKLITKGFKLHNIPEYLIKYRITKKSTISNYRDQQYDTSDKVRLKLLRSIYPSCTDSDIEIHNKICNEQICDIDEAEVWLLKIKDILIKCNKTPENYINSLLGRLWTNINLVNNSSIREYKKSTLARNMSFYDFSRFIKRKLL